MMLENEILDEGIYVPIDADTTTLLAMRRQRWGALVVDIFIYALFMSVIDHEVSGGSFAEKYWLGLHLLAFPLYKISCEAIWGYTLGKRLLGIKVMKKGRKYTPIGWWRALGRFVFFWPILVQPLLMAVDFFDFSGTFEFVISFAVILIIIFSWIMAASVFFDNKGQGWHNRIMKTICIQTTPLFLNERKNTA